MTWGDWTFMSYDDTTEEMTKERLREIRQQMSEVRQGLRKPTFSYSESFFPYGLTRPTVPPAAEPPAEPQPHVPPKLTLIRGGKR